MKERCDRSWEVDLFRARRLAPKDSVSFEKHLRTCAACQEQRKADDWLQQVGRGLTDDEPSELELRRVRARVLRDAATGDGTGDGISRGAPWWPRLAVLGILLAGVALWAFSPRNRAQRVVEVTAPPASSARPSEPYAATVVASNDAHWQQERAQGVERVTLEQGSLHVQVRPQTVAERFLVVLPDGDLEVRGTTFDVRVEHDATVSVHVDEGVVELRLRDLEVKRLGAGGSWAPTSEAPASAPAPAPPTLAPKTARRGPGPDVQESPRPPSSSEVYTRAMALLRDGRNEDAAAAFHSFAQAQPGASQAEDASFLEAVALARAGRSDAAALAAEHHLASFPASFHRKQASLLVAKAATKRGDCARARSVMAPWMTDAEVIAALKACPP